MSVVLLRIWGKCQRPYGYEVRADFSAGGPDINETLMFAREPAQAEIDAAVAARAIEIQTRLEVEEMTRNVEEVLA